VLRMRHVGQRVIISRATDDSFPSDSSVFVVTQIGPPAKKTSMNLLALESGKSRQRHKDVKAALLSVSRQAGRHVTHSQMPLITSITASLTVPEGLI